MEVSMKTQHMDQETRMRDQPPTERDPLARESFTWRRMRPWHIWTLAIAAAVLTALGVIYV